MIDPCNNHQQRWLGVPAGKNPPESLVTFNRNQSHLQRNSYFVAVGENLFIGINTTILDHLTIGRLNVIGAGSLILKDTPDEGMLTQPAAELQGAEPQAEKALTEVVA